MRLCNETITVFNARVDPGTGGKAWVPTVIAGAGWYATDATTVDGARGGLVAADRVTVRIPEDADAGGKAYVDPVAYAGAESVEGVWTLANGDVVVRGEVASPSAPSPSAQALTPPPEGEASAWTPAALKRAFAECVTVLAVTDNRRAPNARHWRVVGA